MKKGKVYFGVWGKKMKRAKSSEDIRKFLNKK